MAFADWKKRSKLFADTQRRLNAYAPITEICRAAYKAGERDGRKQTESVAEQAIKLRELMRSNDEAHRGARQGASGGADCSAAT